MGDDATLGGTGWSLTKPVTNLQDRDPRRLRRDHWHKRRDPDRPRQREVTDALRAGRAYLREDATATITLTGGTSSGGSEVSGRFGAHLLAVRPARRRP